MNRDPRLFVSVSTALDRGASELRGLKEQLERLEHHIEHIFEASQNTLASDAIASLQEFDLIIQSSEALADFIEEISKCSELHSIDICTLSAIEKIRLGDLADRLSGEKIREKSQHTPELF